MSVRKVGALIQKAESAQARPSLHLKILNYIFVKVIQTLTYDCSAQELFKTWWHLAWTRHHRESYSRTNNKTPEKKVWYTVLIKISISREIAGYTCK